MTPKEALELAEGALAVKSSLRDNEQARCERALQAVRQTLSDLRSSPIDGYNVFNGGQGD